MSLKGDRNILLKKKKKTEICHCYFLFNGKNYPGQYAHRLTPLYVISRMHSLTLARTVKSRSIAGPSPWVLFPSNLESNNIIAKYAPFIYTKNLIRLPIFKNGYDNKLVDFNFWKVMIIYYKLIPIFELNFYFKLVDTLSASKKNNCAHASCVLLYLVLEIENVVLKKQKMDSAIYFSHKNILYSDYPIS